MHPQQVFTHAGSSCARLDAHAHVVTFSLRRRSLQARGVFGCACELPSIQAVHHRNAIAGSEGVCRGFIIQSNPFSLDVLHTTSCTHPRLRYCTPSSTHPRSPACCRPGARLDVHAALLAVGLDDAVAAERIGDALGHLLGAQAQAAQNLVLGHAALACTAHQGLRFYLGCIPKSQTFSELKLRRHRTWCLGMPRSPY